MGEALETWKQFSCFEIIMKYENNSFLFCHCWCGQSVSCVQYLYRSTLFVDVSFNKVLSGKSLFQLLQMSWLRQLAGLLMFLE